MEYENIEYTRLLANLSRVKNDKQALGKRVKFFKLGLNLTLLAARAKKAEEKRIKELVFGTKKLV